MYQKIHKARQDHLCTGCQNIIEKGTKYYQIGLIPRNKDYHIECQPNAQTMVEAGPGKPTPEAVFESTMIELKTKRDPVQTRDAKGRFVKK